MFQDNFGGKSIEGLWDTGSMITLVDRLWLQENLPGEVIVPVMQFLEGEHLTIRAANKSEIPFDGVVVLRFSLGDEHDGFLVPALVSSQPISEPIIGYNVIEHLVLNGTDEEHEKLKSCLKGANISNVDPLIALIQKQAAEPDFLVDIKTSEAVKIPAGFKKQIRCKICYKKS